MNNIEEKIIWLEKFVGYFEDDDWFSDREYILVLPHLIDLYYYGSASDKFNEAIVEEIKRIYDYLSENFESVEDSKVVHFNKFVRKEKKHENVFEDLNAIYKELSDRKSSDFSDTIKELNKFREQNGKPPIQDAWKVHNCSKCGLKLETVMGYCCPHFDCPTGLGPTVC